MAKFDAIAKTAGGLGKAIIATAASEATDAALKALSPVGCITPRDINPNLLASPAPTESCHRLYAAEPSDGWDTAP